MKISISHCLSERRRRLGCGVLALTVCLLLVSVVTCDTESSATGDGGGGWLDRETAGSRFDWQPIVWRRPNGERHINWRRIALESPTVNRDEYATLDQLFGAQNQSRQVRQVGEAPTSKQNRQQSGNSNIHILSQEHVILHHHLSSPSWRHSGHHAPKTGPPRSLVFFQASPSVARSSGAGTEANVDNAETFYIRKGANGTLPCLPVLPADSQATQNKIEWFKGEKKLMEAESKQIVVWNTKNSIAYLPETGALLFRGVTNDDSGEYHCVLTKTTDSSISEDGIVRFYVQGKC